MSSGLSVVGVWTAGRDLVTAGHLPQLETPNSKALVMLFSSLMPRGDALGCGHVLHAGTGLPAKRLQPFSPILQPLNETTSE